MSPVLVLLRLVRFSPRYFLTCVLFATVLFFWLPIPLGLATRVFFDALSGQAAAGLNAWSAIAVLVGLQIGEVFAGPLLGNPWNSMQQKSHVLLQRNLFAGVLRGYGVVGLPVSVGETISRFRDDPHTMGDGLDALCDLIGRSLFALGAAVVMWQINSVLTLVLFVPMLLSSLVMEALGTKTMAYRAASRAATSRLTGLLGELLSAQLAIKVGGAAPHVLRRLQVWATPGVEWPCATRRSSNCSTRSTSTPITSVPVWCCSSRPRQFATALSRSETFRCSWCTWISSVTSPLRGRTAGGRKCYPMRSWRCMSAQLPEC